MSLKNTAYIDKPREKLINKGPGSLELEELVAAIIGRGIPGCDAVQIGKKVAKILMSKTYETEVADLCGKIDHGSDLRHRRAGRRSRVQ